MIQYCIKTKANSALHLFCIYMNWVFLIQKNTSDLKEQMKETYQYICKTYTGVKKSLVLEPGTSKISGRTRIYFHPMSGGRSKKFSASLFDNIFRTS